MLSERPHAGSLRLRRADRNADRARRDRRARSASAAASSTSRWKASCSSARSRAPRWRSAPGSTWLGVGAAVLAGILFLFASRVRLDHAAADQIVSATALNILALGHDRVPDGGHVRTPRHDGPGSDAGAGLQLPRPDVAESAATLFEWINGVFLSYTPIVYIAIILAVVPPVGDVPDPMGACDFAPWASIREPPTPSASTLFEVATSLFWPAARSAGLAGANLTLEQVGAFTENMTNGRGFIALAANIFGRWTPGAATSRACLFGFADALQIKLQLFRDVIPIPAAVLLHAAVRPHRDRARRLHGACHRPRRSRQALQGAGLDAPVVVGLSLPRLTFVASRLIFVPRDPRPRRCGGRGDDCEHQQNNGIGAVE